MSNSWTDLNISDALKQACADVQSKTKEDFGAFVKDALSKFGVESADQLTHIQKGQLEEHILAHWKGTYKGNEAEHLTEISKEKLGQYIKKAKTDYADQHVEADKKIKAADAAFKAGTAANPNTKQGKSYLDRADELNKMAEPHMKRGYKRATGIDRAVNKLVKEEADEIEIAATDLSKEVTLDNLNDRLARALRDGDAGKATALKLAIKMKKAKKDIVESKQYPNRKSNLLEEIYNICALDEGKNAEGRSDLSVNLDDEDEDDIKKDKQALKDQRIYQEIDTDEEQPGDTISKIVDANGKALEGKVVKEPGVMTDAAKTLSPGEMKKVAEAAKKMGLQKESAEQLDEISKEKLGSYVKNAKEDIFRRAKTEKELETDSRNYGNFQTRHGGYVRGSDDRIQSEIDKKLVKNKKKLVRRSVGVDKAIDKLTGKAKVPAKD